MNILYLICQIPKHQWITSKVRTSEFKMSKYSLRVWTSGSASCVEAVCVLRFYSDSDTTAVCSDASHLPCFQTIGLTAVLGCTALTDTYKRTSLSWQLHFWLLTSSRCWKHLIIFDMPGLSSLPVAFELSRKKGGFVHPHDAVLSSLGHSEFSHEYKWSGGRT